MQGVWWLDWLIIQAATSAADIHEMRRMPLKEVALCILKRDIDITDSL